MRGGFEAFAKPLRGEQSKKPQRERLETAVVSFDHLVGLSEQR